MIDDGDSAPTKCGGESGRTRLADIRRAIDLVHGFRRSIPERIEHPVLDQLRLQQHSSGQVDRVEIALGVDRDLDIGEKADITAKTGSLISFS